jgi:predicted Zn-dependent protease
VYRAQRRAQRRSRAPSNPIARDRAAYLKNLDGLVVGQDPAAGVFDGTLFRQPDLDFRIVLPEGWKTVNSPSAVGGVASDQSAMIQLSIQDAGSDPRASARAFVAKEQIPVVKERPVAIGEFEGYQVRAKQTSQQGEVGALFTWIAYRGQVYRIECVSAEANFERFAPTCGRTLDSFRPLSAADRKSIRTRVLRIATAQPGESLAALSARTGNVWSLEETAVANGLQDTSRPPADGLAKIAVAVPYQPRSSTSAR